MRLHLDKLTFVFGDFDYIADFGPADFGPHPAVSLYLQDEQAYWVGHVLEDRIYRTHINAVQVVFEWDNRHLDTKFIQRMFPHMTSEMFPHPKEATYMLNTRSWDVTVSNHRYGGAMYGKPKMTWVRNKTGEVVQNGEGSMLTGLKKAMTGLFL